MVQTHGVYGYGEGIGRTVAQPADGRSEQQVAVQSALNGYLLFTLAEPYWW